MLGAVVLLLGVLALPAQGAQKITIRITADGPVPATVTVSAGDRIVFRNDDPTFPHAVESSTTNWSFESGLLTPGEEFPVPEALTKPGTYGYQGAGLDDFEGRVLVPTKSGSTPAPTPRKTSSPPPSAQPEPSDEPTSGASPAPSATGGTGSAGVPQLPGFGGLGSTPQPAPEPSGPAPDVAPELPGETALAEPDASTGPLAIVGGPLPQAPTPRRYGLPAVLAAVGIAGVASLLVRLLLAEAGPRGRAAGRRTPGTVVPVR